MLDVLGHKSYSLDLPFDDESLPKLIDKIVLAHFECPPFFSPEAKDLINEILTPNPNKRPSIPQIKAHPWFTGHSTDKCALPTEIKKLEKIGSKDVSEITPDEYVPTK